MDFLHAAILGIIEGITEFLPISSTGHLIIATHLLGISATEFWKSFTIAIQLGAILAVALVCWNEVRRKVLWSRVMAAFLPTAVIGLLFHSLVKKYLLGNSWVVIWALALGGFVLILEKFIAKKEATITNIESIPFFEAALVGVFQSFALVPGVSRSAATIIGGLARGFSRQTIVLFSFLVSIPTMAAATVLDLAKSSFGFSSHDWLVLALGSVVSFVVAWVSVRWLLSHIKTHTFFWFGIYRIVAAIVFAFILR